MGNSRLLIIGQLPPPVHGSNVMAAVFLESLQKLGHKVDIVQKTFSKDQVEVGLFSFLKILKVPIIAFKIFQQILRSKPDLCFYFNTVVLSAFLVDAIFIFILRLLKVPYILYCHGKGLSKIGRGNFIWQFIARKTIGGAVGAIVLGERLKEDLSPYLNSQSLYVLPNAIPGYVESLPDRNGRSGFQLIFLANLKKDKGPLEFLKMAKEVSKRAPQVRFVLGGPKKFEHFYQELLNFIKRAGLEDSVKLTGGLYEEAKRQAFQESDIFVLPTQNDAFPLVILEAMKQGLPVISSSEGAIPEMIQDGKNGYIINPKDISQMSDRVLRLVNNDSLRLRIGKEARKMYEEKFTVEVYQRNLAKALDYFSGVLQKS